MIGPRGGTLRAERYFLPELELDDEELAALQTCFFLLEGRFAYAEPLRLALQNLALGRSAGPLAATPTGTAGRVEVRDPDYSLELQGRLGKLEGAIAHLDGNVESAVEASSLRNRNPK